jgi:4-hydroxy-tetrahydrodipicolinate synthase
MAKSKNPKLSGLVHTPLTPFRQDGKVDLALLPRVIEFHLSHGADVICAPTHAGESPSLSEDERRKMIREVVQIVNGRVPVVTHISGAGTLLSARSAADAQEAGADAVLATAPYYWKPPAHMLVNHFGEIGDAIDIPVLIHNTPEEMGGTAFSTDLVLKVIERVKPIAGMVDSSLNWEFQVEVLPLARKLRPEFLLLSGNEHMVSIYAIGGSGAFSAISSVAPNLIRSLHANCLKGDYAAAQQAQFAASRLYSLMKPWPASSIKAALSMLGRDLGPTRPPVMPLQADAKAALWQSLEASKILANEPRGW